MQGVQSSLSNLMRQTNQIQQVGSINPPNMTNVPASLLQRASPVGTSLVDTTKTNQNVSDQAAAKCRSYKGIEGLRRLQRDQANRSYYDAGCGWIYEPSNGINPTVNQGALGTAQGPIRDTVKGGGKWYWDLAEAEKEVTQKICANAKKCSQLKFMGQFAEVCGFCKTTGAIIPVEKTAGGYKARYPNEAPLKCEPQNIVAGGSGSCPPNEGFQSKFLEKETTFGEYIRNEGFVGGGGVSLDDLDNCKPPLTRDCVILAARLAGCSDQGTLIAALGQSKQGQDYDAMLRTKPSFTAYQTTANPNITGAIVKDGSAGIQTALSDFNNLVNNANSKNAKLGMAARDLCLKAGEFENFNFCNEVSNTTVINEQTVKCLQEDWLNRGGTEKGSGYPMLGSFKGRPKQAYLDYVNGLLAKTKSTDKLVNQQAIMELIGMNTAGFTNDLPRDENTRGAETVWIDLVDTSNTNNAPIILRCDLRLAKDGEVIPSFADKNVLTNKWGVPGDNIAFTSAFEIRPDDNTIVHYSVRTDDGFMLSLNQNPFENTSYKMNDWGSWRYQGPTMYHSGAYPIAGEKQNKRNVVVTKWFQGYGLATFEFYYRLGTQPVSSPGDGSFASRANLYVTQEPLAPWLQYEICSRPNRGNGSTLGLFEKRWNGQAAYAWGSGQPIWSFDIDTRSTIPQSSMNGNYLSFTSGSWWHTTSQFAFTAFKTVTMLIRPMGNIADGASVSLFHHINFKNQFGYGAYLVRQGNRYFIRHWKGNMTEEHPVYVNQWNFIVIQYVGDRFGIRNFDLHVWGYDFVKMDSGRRELLGWMKQRQNGSGAILYGNAQNDRRNAGHLVLGGTGPNYKDASGRVSWQSQSFTGDVAYIHGFRNYIDTEELLKTEIDNKWISRWPRKD